VKNSSPNSGERQRGGRKARTGLTYDCRAVVHDRQPGLALTPGSVRDYAFCVLKVKKEIPVNYQFDRVLDATATDSTP
jgi:hypothetical protein